MGYKCAVPACTSGYKSNKQKVSLFRIPKDKIQEWRTLIPRRADRRLSDNDHICEVHFDPSFIVREDKTECYTIKLMRPRLAADAVPTIFPGCPKPRRILKRESPILIPTDVPCNSKKQKFIAPIIEPIIDVDECPPESEPSTNIPEVEVFNLCSEILKMQNKLRLPSQTWGIHHIQGEVWITELGLFKNREIILKNVTLTPSSVTFKILGQEIALYEKATINCILDFEEVLEQFQKVFVCFGSLKVLPSSLKSNTMVFQEGLSTWRHSKCDFMINSPRKKSCDLCTKGGIYLDRLMKKSESSQVIKEQKQNQKRKVLSRLKKKVLNLSQELQVLKEKLHNVDENLLMNKIENLPENQKMLILECMRVGKFKSKNTRRYTSGWMLVCLLLNIRSPSTYKFLRNNDILPLPAKSTIKQYLSRIDQKCELDNEFFKAFECKLSDTSEHERHGLVIFDEISVRKSLNWKNTKLIDVEEPNGSESATGLSADHALVFRFRSFMSTELCHPVAVFATKGSTNEDCLAELIIAIIQKLEKCGVSVDGIVCDGATSHRKMWAKFGISGILNNPSNNIPHPVSPDTRKLFFFSDVPHLFKCIRNRFFRKSILIIPEGVIKWEYYKTLHELESKLPRYLKVCPKLTPFHVNPSNQALKMKVRFCTQIFSNSVCNGLKFYMDKGEIPQEAAITKLFSKKLNDCFDALNRRDPAEGIKKNSSDLEVLKSTLTWLDEWQNMVISDKIIKDQCLTHNTVEGLRVTLLSTLELVDYLLNSVGFHYVLTNKFNQDRPHVC